jgi:hypothetical protein
MSRWTWWETLVVLGAMIVTGLTIAAARRQDTPPVRYDFIPLDTVGCGVLVRCEIKTMPRFMSHNPFAETR